jgi:methyl-accepting chemotaxis protein
VRTEVQDKVTTFREETSEQIGKIKSNITEGVDRARDSMQTVRNQMEEKAEIFRARLSENLDSARDNAVDSLEKMREGTERLKSQISEQFDKVKETMDKSDTLTQHIQKVKSQSLQTLDQLHGQVQSSLAGMG